MSAIMECDSDLIRKTLYEQIPILEKEKSDTELQLTLEKAKQVKLTVSEVRFFLNALRKGDPDSIKYQKALISVLVNAVYLYDDKITLIFNSGDNAVTLDTALLEKIEQQADSVPVEDRFVYEQLSSTTYEKSELIPHRECVRIFHFYQGYFLLMFIPGGFFILRVFLLFAHSIPDRSPATMIAENH